MYVDVAIATTFVVDKQNLVKENEKNRRCALLKIQCIKLILHFL